jgi:hypothetical protein
MVDTVCPAVWRGGNLAQRTGKQMARAVGRRATPRRLFVPGSDQLEGPAVSEVINRYFPRPFDGPATLFSTSRASARAGDRYLGWREYLRGPTELHEVAGDHVSILRRPDVQQLADALPDLLRRHRPS